MFLAELSGFAVPEALGKRALGGAGKAGLSTPEGPPTGLGGTGIYIYIYIYIYILYRVEMQKVQCLAV